MRLASRPNARRVTPVDCFPTSGGHRGSSANTRLHGAEQGHCRGGPGKSNEKPIWSKAMAGGNSRQSHSAVPRNMHSPGVPQVRFNTSGYTGYTSHNSATIHPTARPQSHLLGNQGEQKQRPLSAKPYVQRRTTAVSGSSEHVPSAAVAAAWLNRQPPGMPPSTRVARPKSAHVRPTPPTSSRPEDRREYRPRDTFKANHNQYQDRVHTYGPSLVQKVTKPSGGSESSLPSAKTQAVSDRSGSSSFNNKLDSVDQTEATGTSWLQKWAPSQPSPNSARLQSSNGSTETGILRLRVSAPTAAQPTAKTETRDDEQHATVPARNSSAIIDDKTEKSLLAEASENQQQPKRCARSGTYLIRPSSAHPMQREACRPDRQRPTSANGQPRLHGGVQHAEFQWALDANAKYDSQQSGTALSNETEECSASQVEQREYLQRLLVATASHRRGLPDIYSFGKIIGVGSFGTVRLAYHKLTGQKVAIKTYERAKMKDPQQWRRVQQEARVMERLSNCPLICRFLEAFETSAPRRAHLIMEHLPGGSLCSYVKSKRKLSETEVRPLMLQLAMAIEHMHSLDVIHRDIKLENILFLDDTHKVVRVIDFGFSTRCAADRRLRLFCGTPSYMSPEIVRRTDYRGKPVDMWSFGVVTYACLGGYFPFAAKSQPELYRKILRGSFRIPEGLSEGAILLLQSAILADVNRRLTAPEARRHQWLVAGLSSREQKLGTELGPYTRSKNPQDDIHRESLNRITEGLGVPRDVLLRQITHAEHSPITACYYLLMGALRRPSSFFQSECSDSGTLAKSTVSA